MALSVRDKHAINSLNNSGFAAGLAKVFAATEGGKTLQTIMRNAVGSSKNAHIVEKKSVATNKQMNQSYAVPGLGKPISVPNTQSRIMTKLPPKRVSLPNGDVIVTHREYFNDLSCQAAFTPQSFNINPGNSALFPWLTKIASAFESYKFLRLCFRYLTDCSTSTGGRVMMTVDYDPTDVLPASKAQLLAYRGSVAAPAWSEACYEATAEDLHKLPQYYVTNNPALASTAALPNAMDRSNFVGQFIVASQGGPNAITGELYVEYTVKLITPQLSPSQQSNSYAYFDNASAFTQNHLLLIPAPGSAVLGSPYAAGIVFTTNGTTFGVIFNIPGKWVVTLNINGTTISGGLVDDAGTTVAGLSFGGHNFRQNSINSTSTQITCIEALSCQAGQLWYPKITAASVTSVQATFSLLDPNP
jgi:hypothetical protein